MCVGHACVCRARMCVCVWGDMHGGVGHACVCRACMYVWGTHVCVGHACV